MGSKDEMIGEDWKGEFEKILLSKKYHRACTIVGIAFTTPTIPVIKRAYGHVVDYVSSIPIGSSKRFKKAQDERKKFLEKLDEICKVLYGEPTNPEVQELMEKYKVSTKTVRRNIRMNQELSDIPNIIIALRNVLIAAGEFAVSKGLRITIKEPQAVGMKAILEEEGFGDLDLDEEGK